MTNKVLLITGGTGGHVIPAENLANFLSSHNINCNLMLDPRGHKYLNNFNGKIHIINSSNLNGNLYNKLFGLINLFIGFVKSFFIILFYKPNIVISFGSYASFFPMLSCLVLKLFFKIKIFIHEQNSVLGRTNSFFLYFANKLFLNFDILVKIQKKFQSRTFVVGMPEKISKKEIKNNNEIPNKFTIFICGGSQGSEFLSRFSIDLIKNIEKESIITANFIIQCPKHMNEVLNKGLSGSKSRIIVQSFFNKIDEVLRETSICIS
tara:strand:+ start:86 stop:877 length:792 start_codon:yes stop_codon:yes gene_type:complete